MVFRVLQFLIGVVLGGAGGYLIWTQRADATHLFPPGAAGLPMLLLAGVLSVTTGLVFLISALHPRPNQRRLAAERTAREDAALGEAEAYYSQRARAADRDWRSGDILPLAPPAPLPATITSPVESTPVAPSVAPPTAATPPLAPLAAMAPPVTREPAPAEPPPAQQPQQRSLGVPPAAPAPAELAAATGAAARKPSASIEPAASGAPAAPSPFRAQVTLAPIPRASEPPPPPAHQAVAATSAPLVTSDDPHAEIRAAINSGRLDEADRMLAASRDTATGIGLAQLTALAGDHAAVSGRQSHAKWLWRLALKRFGELDAMNSPAAKAVAESLRQAG